jgi:hypothetical protein
MRLIAQVETIDIYRSFVALDLRTRAFRHCLAHAPGADKTFQANPRRIDWALASVEEHVVEKAAKETAEEGRDHWYL